MAKAYDVVVIGGGIIGCSIAWRLAQTGRRVALLERGRVGGEASSAAGGIFIPDASPDIAPDHLNFWVTSNAMYPAFVEEVRAATGHAFEFRVSGRLVVALNDEEIAQLQAHYARQEAAGIRARWLSGADARAAEPLLTPDAQAAIFYPDHGLVDNPKLTVALGAALRAAGGDLFENRGAVGLVLEGERVVGVDTPTGPVNAPVVVNSAGSWSGLIDRRAPAPIRPAKGQMLAVDRGAGRMERIIAGVVGSAVPRADGRTLIGATVHDVGFDKDVIAGDVFGLFERAVRVVPSLRDARFLEAWAGLRPIAPDRRPVIGRDPEIAGLVWATGHFTMGILLAPATAKAVAELIVSGDTPAAIAGFGVERFRRPVAAVPA
jgi:glycine oxidase